MARTAPAARAGILVVCAIALLGFAGTARAADITVTSTLDDDGTGCTLREAIASANFGTGDGCANGDATGTDRIIFDPTAFPPGGAVETIHLTAIAPVIQSNLDIQGYGMNQLTVDGDAGVGRVFTDNLATAEISGMTITGGQPPAAVAATAFGGGISNTGALTLDDVCVCGNAVAASTASSGISAIATGGGIYSSAGSVTLENSVIDGNTVTATQSAATGTDSANATGGGMYVHGSAVIANSTISDNTATSTKSGSASTAYANGGGLFAAGVPVTAKRSTFNANEVHATSTPAGTAIAYGGGIELNGTASANPIELSTIADNRTDTSSGLNQRGAGIYVESDGLLAIVSSTIARNGTSTATPAVDGKNIDDAFGSNTISNSIVSDPVGGGGNCYLSPGALVSQGYTDDYTPTVGHTGTCGFAGATDSAANPLLDSALAANGGATETLALQTGSPMIDTGSNAGQSTPGIDQRGLSRPSDFFAIPNTTDGTDIGAFELQSPDKPPATNPPAAGPTGQRAAALKKCKKKKSAKARKKCKRKARRLPV
jgi:CSLREA domain-containing protein